MKYWLIALSLLTACANISAAGVKEPLYGQVFFGSLKLNDNTVSIRSNDETLEGELPSSIPYFGAAAQVILKDDVFGYGWEGGGFFSWINDSVSYYASGGGNGASVRINVDNNFWSFETFMGLYGSFKPVDRLRFYAGAGPLFLLATTKVDNAEEPAQPEQPLPNTNSGSTIVIDVNKYNTDFTVGYYARIGFDFYLQDQWWIGANVRHMNAEVDLDKTIGKFDVNGEIYLFTLTKRY